MGLPSYMIAMYRQKFNDYVNGCTECGGSGGSSGNINHTYKCSHWYYQPSSHKIFIDQDLTGIVQSIIGMIQSEMKAFDIPFSQVDDNMPSENHLKRVRPSIDFTERVSKKGCFVKDDLTDDITDEFDDKTPSSNKSKRIYRQPTKIIQDTTRYKRLCV